MGKGKKKKSIVEVRPTYRAFDPHESDANGFDRIPDGWFFDEGDRKAVEPEPVTRAQRVYYFWLVLWNAQEHIKRSNKYTMSAHIDAAMKERRRLGMPFREGMSVLDRVVEMGGIVKAAMVEDQE